jgi:hypothetical protein
MASSRKCGYCQMAGHIKRNCPTFHLQRKEVFLHTVAMRKKIYSELVERGYGVGALLRIKGYGGEKNSIIMSYADNITRWEFMGYRPIRYSKQVRLMPHTPTFDEWHYVSFKVHSSGQGGSQVETASLSLCNMVLPYDEFEQMNYASFVLSPSNDYDARVTDAIFEENIRLHDRLRLPTEKDGILYRKNVQF